MIIHTHVDLSKLISDSKEKEIKKEVIVRPAKKAEKKKNKVTSEEPVLEAVLDENVEEEKIDLSKWLEEDIDE